MPLLGPQFHAVGESMRGTMIPQMMLAWCEESRAGGSDKEFGRARRSWVATHDLVRDTAQHDRLGPETRGPDLGNERVADRSERRIVSKVKDDEQAARGHLGAVVREEAHDADEQKDNVHHDETRDVERAATKPGDH